MPRTSAPSIVPSPVEPVRSSPSGVRASRSAAVPVNRPRTPIRSELPRFGQGGQVDAVELQRQVVAGRLVPEVDRARERHPAVAHPAPDVLQLDDLVADRRAGRSRPRRPGRASAGATVVPWKIAVVTTAGSPGRALIAGLRRLAVEVQHDADRPPGLDELPDVLVNEGDASGPSPGRPGADRPSGGTGSRRSRA